MPLRYSMAIRNNARAISYSNNNIESDDDENEEFDNIKCYKASAPMRECNACSYNDEDMFCYNNCNNEKIKREIFEVKENECKNSKKENNEKVEFSNKELILTQDIFDGYWKINPQANLLIEKEKTVFENIEKIVKEKKFR